MSSLQPWQQCNSHVRLFPLSMRAGTNSSLAPACIPQVLTCLLGAIALGHATGSAPSVMELISWDVGELALLPAVLVRLARLGTGADVREKAWGALLALRVHKGSACKTERFSH